MLPAPSPPSQYWFENLGFQNGSPDGARLSSPKGLCLDKDEFNIIVTEGTFTKTSPIRTDVLVLAGNHSVRMVSTESVCCLAGSILNPSEGFQNGSANHARYEPHPSQLPPFFGLSARCLPLHYLLSFLLWQLGRISCVDASSENFSSVDLLFMLMANFVFRFFQPGGICLDRKGNYLIADTSNHAIRMIFDRKELALHYLYAPIHLHHAHIFPSQ